MAFFKRLLVASNDASKIETAHPWELHWFDSPIEKREEHGRNGSVDSDADELYKIKEMAHGHGDHHHHFEDVPEDEPLLKRPHEASSIHLFYDLFFVANLTTFTHVHDINDSTTLTSYIGFLALIWFTWLQVTIYDIRFAGDSGFDRICKAIQFGIMTGFAVAGSGFKVIWAASDEDASKSMKSFHTLALILMVSRLVLAIQYVVVLVWTRKFKKTYLPIGAHILVHFAASAVYFGLYFGFNVGKSRNIVIAFYVTTVIEALIIVMTSAQYKFLNFRRTLIVERLGLLTLIILGEGIIGLLGAIQKIGKDLEFTGDVVGMIVCGVIIIYALYMLYFDQREVENVGTVRQQLWTLLHFPLYAAILMVLEGISQLALWRKLINSIGPFQTTLNSLSVTGKSEDIAKKVDDAMADLFERFSSGGHGIAKPDIADMLHEVETATNPNEIRAAVTKLFQTGVGWVAQNFGLTPTMKPGQHHLSEQETMAGLSHSFQTVYVYFFAGAGVTLFMLSILFMLGKRYKVRGDYFNVVIRTLLGIILTVLIVLGFGKEGTPLGAAGTSFVLGPWMLPLVAIFYVLAVAMDHVIINIVRWSLAKELSGRRLSASVAA